MALGIKTGGRQRRDLHRFCAQCLQKFSRKNTSLLLGSSKRGPAEDRVHSDTAFCSGRCRNIWWHANTPPEQRQERLGKAVKSMRERGHYNRFSELRLAEGVAHPFRRPDVREKAAEATTRWKAENREQFIAGAREGGRASMHVHKTTNYPSTRLGIIFRSSWERTFAEALADRNIPFAYESKTFETPHGIYTPDFHLPSLNLWVEIKGWDNGKQSEKREWLITQGHGVLVLGAEFSNDRRIFDAARAIDALPPPQ